MVEATIKALEVTSIHILSIHCVGNALSMLYKMESTAIHILKEVNSHTELTFCKELLSFRLPAIQGHR